MAGTVEQVGGFASWRSYWDFRREVRSRRRFMPSPASRAFLDELARTSKSRARRITAGSHFCRAQVAHEDFEDTYAGTIARPADPERMMPRPDAASDGRANPEGIPRLYMANDRHTAIAEVRPWIGSLVSVAILKMKRDLKVVDLTGEARKTILYLEGEPPAAEREAAVWREVAAAFSEPVIRGDDRAGYAATQIIAELLEHEGYDGIAYGSGFGKGAKTNIVLFDVAAAELVACEIHEISDVTLEFKETENPYFMQGKADGGTEAVVNTIEVIGPAGTAQLPAGPAA